MQNLETDKGILEERCAQLEFDLAESQANANVMANVDTTGECHFPFLPIFSCNKPICD